MSSFPHHGPSVAGGALVVVGAAVLAVGVVAGLVVLAARVIGWVTS